MIRKDIIIYIPKGESIAWSIDEDRKNAIQFLRMGGFKITNNIFKATHIYSVWLDSLLAKRLVWLLIKRIFRKKLIAVVTNDLSFDPKKIALLAQLIDLAIVPSTKMFNLLERYGINVKLIPFFVDSNVFRPVQIDKTKICKKLLIDSKKLEGKLIFASFQRDSLGSDLHKPKWQKNPDLLIEILKTFDQSKILLLLAGPRRHYIVSRCLSNDINFLYFGDSSYIEKWQDDLLINNHSSEVINLLYGLSDIYIVTSKAEGGPKAILECSLSKKLIFSTKVGFATDILHPELIFEDKRTGDLIRKIDRYVENPDEFRVYIDYNYNKVAALLTKERFLGLYQQLFT